MGGGGSAAPNQKLPQAVFLGSACDGGGPEVWGQEAFHRLTPLGLLPPTELAPVGLDDTWESAPSEDSSWERTQQSVNTVSRTLCSPGRVHRRRPLTTDWATGSSPLLLPGGGNHAKSQAPGTLAVLIKSPRAPATCS